MLLNMKKGTRWIKPQDELYVLVQVNVARTYSVYSRTYYDGSVIGQASNLTDLITCLNKSLSKQLQKQTKTEKMEIFKVFNAIEKEVSKNIHKKSNR